MKMERIWGWSKSNLCKMHNPWFLFWMMEMSNNCQSWKPLFVSMAKVSSYLHLDLPVQINNVSQSNELLSYKILVIFWRLWHTLENPAKTSWKFSTEWQQKEQALSEELKAMQKIWSDQMYLAQAQSQWFSDETLRFPKNPTIWILGWAINPLPSGHDAPVTSRNACSRQPSILKIMVYSLNKVLVLMSPD